MIGYASFWLLPSLAPTQVTHLQIRPASSPPLTRHSPRRSTDNSQRNIYDKGLVAEVSKFLFGDGFAITGGDAWRARRRAVGPSLHRAYLEEMIGRVFGPSAVFATEKLSVAAASGAPVNMEAIFSQLTLDIIGKSVFNYDFNSLTTDSPLIQVRVCPLGAPRPPMSSGLSSPYIY